EAAWMAADAALDAHGGYGFAVEYGIERVSREICLTLVTPVSNDFVLANIAEHTVGMPRSY
ncbi:MAG: acyl-CoA dehydrogenase, partial [Actinomycetota bacterium]